MCRLFREETIDSMPLQPSRPMPIPEGHPLRHLFRNLTEASFEQVGTTDPELTIYVTGLLVEFTHVENLYRIRDANGKRPSPLPSPRGRGGKKPILYRAQLHVVLDSALYNGRR